MNKKELKEIIKEAVKEAIEEGTYFTGICRTTKIDERNRK